MMTREWLGWFEVVRLWHFLLNQKKINERRVFLYSIAYNVYVHNVKGN